MGRQHRFLAECGMNIRMVENGNTDLFVSLPHYNGRDQVCGHISKTGKPTPPFPYSIDYSASKQVLRKGNGSALLLRTMENG
jgi:hypothetical protein